MLRETASSRASARVAGSRAPGRSAPLEDRLADREVDLAVQRLGAAAVDRERRGERVVGALGHGGLARKWLLSDNPKWLFHPSHLLPSLGCREEDRRRRMAAQADRATKLSVNLNKVALLRNQRDVGYPSVLEAARLVVGAGAHGITVHPRPDERHIRRTDVHGARGADRGRARPAVEYNIEGYPAPDFVALIQRGPADPGHAGAGRARPADLRSRLGPRARMPAG